MPKRYWRRGSEKPGASLLADAFACPSPAPAPFQVVHKFPECGLPRSRTRPRDLRAERVVRHRANTEDEISRVMVAPKPAHGLRFSRFPSELSRGRFKFFAKLDGPLNKILQVWATLSRQLTDPPVKQVCPRWRPGHGRGFSDCCPETAFQSLRGVMISDVATEHPWAKG